MKGITTSKVLVIALLCATASAQAQSVDAQAPAREATSLADQQRLLDLAWLPTEKPSHSPRAGTELVRGQECPAGSHQYCSDQFPVCCPSSGNSCAAKLSDCR